MTSADLASHFWGEESLVYTGLEALTSDNAVATPVYSWGQINNLDVATSR